MKKYSFIRLLLRVISIQFKAEPWHNALIAPLLVVHASTFALTIIATQRLFDAISLAATGHVGFMDCVIPLLMLAGIMFGQQIINGLDNFHFTIWESKSKGKILAQMQQKLQRVDAVHFEDARFLDDVNKAKEGAQSSIFFIDGLYGLVFFNMAYFAFVGSYLFSLKPQLLWAILLAFLPALFSQVVRIKVFTRLEEQSAPLRRKFEHYQQGLCDREYLKETRLLGAFHYFHKLFKETLHLLARKIWEAERRTALLQLLLNIVTFAGMAVSSWMLFTAAMSGEISVGAFAAIFNSLGMIFHFMQSVVARLGDMTQNVGKIANFVRILDMPERVGVDASPDFSKGIAAESISFTYPGREDSAVRGVSLHIARGETIAIVGENGAGKSTLVRLLTGIYCPSEGRVTLGGLDTAKVATGSLFQATSGVFQKYQRYKMTLAENVAISDSRAEAGSERIGAALSQAEAALSIPLDTMLSPEFDGIDLSGGQWQRVAIARGLYRANGFIVLDEPTSAIDPIEETRIYRQFQRLAEGKCAIVVTHRLGSARLAHRIVVMDGGRIVDSGSHEELMRRPGKYAEMWAAQAAWYSH